VYTPKHFAVEDIEAIRETIRQNSFAMLVTAGERGIEATHLPSVLAPGGDGVGMIRAHLARANRQWEAFDGEREAMLVFAGQHGYISPSWYGPGPAVPTWDYIAVHAYGRPRIVAEPQRVMAMLRELVSQYEQAYETPWMLESQDPDWLGRLAHGIVAFEMPIERVEAKAKLGQNHPQHQAKVAEQLDLLGAHELARIIRAANS
jgi:transcriptional regulator